VDNRMLDETLMEILATLPDRQKITELSAQLLEYLRSRKVSIYGAGAAGQVLSETLSEYDISVSRFIDRAADIIGTICGIPVIKPDLIVELDDKCIVLTANNIKNQSDNLMKAVRQYNAALAILDGFSINRILRYEICARHQSVGHSFDLVRCENCGFEGRGCTICSSYLKKLAGAVTLDDDWRSKEFDWCGYIVGQVCTLNCRYCCEAIPRLQNKGFSTHDDIEADVSKLARSCRFLKFVELIGGEPFLHPEFERVLTSLLAIKNIGYIKMFTNATVVPSDSLCNILKNPRIMLQLSHYEQQVSGKLLENIKATKAKLAAKGIRYVFAPNSEWMDFHSFELHHKKKEQMVEKCCPLLECHRVFKGVLYRCPHQYAGIQLKALNKYPVECVDIHEFSDRDLAGALDAFESLSYTDACLHCTMPSDATIVPMGEQLDESEERS